MTLSLSHTQRTLAACYWPHAIGRMLLAACSSTVSFDWKSISKRRVRRLDLARNSLSSLPMALTELDELEELDLADNQLITVIGALRKLPALRFCCLAGNPLSPEELNQLRNELPQIEIIFAQP